MVICDRLTLSALQSARTRASQLFSHLNKNISKKLLPFFSHIFCSFASSFFAKFSFRLQVFATICLFNQNSWQEEKKSYHYTNPFPSQHHNTTLFPPVPCPTVPCPDPCLLLSCYQSSCSLSSCPYPHSWAQPTNNLASAIIANLFQKICFL